MSISSTAFAAPARALRRTASGVPSTVVSSRLWSGSACRKTRWAPWTSRAAQMASITTRRRPSLKLGTTATNGPSFACSAIPPPRLGTIPTLAGRYPEPRLQLEGEIDDRGGRHCSGNGGIRRLLRGRRVGGPRFVESWAPEGGCGCRLEHLGSYV